MGIAKINDEWDINADQWVMPAFEWPYKRVFTEPVTHCLLQSRAGREGGVFYAPQLFKGSVMRAEGIGKTVVDIIRHAKFTGGGFYDF